MTGVCETQREAEPLRAGTADDRDLHGGSLAASLPTVSGVTAAIEALVGVACVAMAWACWTRRTALFRGVGIALAVAGVVAIVNAVVSSVR
jgi:hypothetical protein